MDDGLMHIGEIAARFNVSVKAMRVYERLGIIRPVGIDSRTGYRLYSAGEARQLGALIELRRLGFSLAEIAKLLQSGMDNNVYMEALVHKKMMWQGEVDFAEFKLGDIEEVIGKLALSKTAAKTDETPKRGTLPDWLVRLHGHNELSEALWL